MRPIILLTFVVWVAGCGGGSPGGAEGDPSRWVVAAIDTEPISAVDLNSAVVRLAHGVDTLSADALRSQALDLLVEQRLLVAEAELRGFSRDSLVLEKLEDVARNRLHKAYWKGVKADNALSAGDIREYFADTVVAVRGPTIMVRDYKIGSRL
ncbi:MAG: hypothetical protein QGH20_08370, partial [Candidatus Latescibacteria bacterium]|nr:hypothetical protein [Candidatus Latescibacterota bacterium]